MNSSIGPPLRHESLLNDEPTTDIELLKIRNLRNQTRQLVQQLWDAARDVDPLEHILHPVKQYPQDLQQMEHAGKSKQNLKGQESASFGDLSVTAMKESYSPRKEISNLSYTQLSKAPPKADWNKPSSPTRSPSPTRRRVRLSPERKKDIRTQMNHEKAMDLLSRDDAFFSELQSFRKLYPDLFFKQDGLEKLKRRPPPVHRPPSPPLEENPIEDEETYYKTGLFRVNERLIPEKVEHPFKKTEDLHGLVVLDPYRNLAEEEPPVKVSIPIKYMKPEKKVYKPHRRTSFDPQDSVNIEDYLHAGYRPFLWSSRAERPSKGIISLKKESRTLEPPLAELKALGLI